MKQAISFLFVGFISLSCIAHNITGEAIDFVNKNYNNSSKSEIVSSKNQIQLSLFSDSLNKYVGGYLFSEGTIKVYVKENKLMAIIPDQPAYELVYVKENEFNVKGAPGYIVLFEIDKKGEISGFTLVQPDGKSKAKKISGEATNISSTPIQLTKEQLEKYTGEYLLSGNELEIYLTENKLMAKIPGQQDYELVPVSQSNFNVKGVSGFSVQFVKDEKGNTTECVISQPGGTVIAKRR